MLENNQKPLSQAPAKPTPLVNPAPAKPTPLVNPATGKPVGAQVQEPQTAVVAAETAVEYVEGAPIFKPGQDDLGYEPKPGESHLVHIKMYTGARYHPHTGEDTTEYRVQKYNVTDFKNFERVVARLGYKYCFLHTPEGFKSRFVAETKVKD